MGDISQPYPNLTSDGHRVPTSPIKGIFKKSLNFPKNYTVVIVVLGYSHT